MPDPTKYHVFLDDFNTIDYNIWSTISSDSSTISAVIQDSDDGRLLITLPATEDKYIIFQAHTDAGGEMFTFESGKKLWFKAKFQSNDVDQVDIGVGITQRVTADTGFLSGGAANGVFFGTDDGDSYIDFYVRSGSATIGSSLAIASLTDATDQVVGFYFDGVNQIQYFTGETTYNGDIDTTAFPTTELLPIFSIRNGEASANTLNMDFICVIKER